MPQQDPRKVTSVPEGYTPEVRNGKTVYVKKTSKPGTNKPVTPPSLKKKTGTMTGKPRPVPKPRPTNTLPEETEDVVYLEEGGGGDDKSKDTGLYGGVDVNRRLLPKTSTNQEYDVYEYPDETGNYTNKSIKKYFVKGNPIAEPSVEDYSTGKFTPKPLSGPKLNEGANVGGVTRIMQPSDSGVNKTNAEANELLLKGTTANKNTFGGAPVSDVKKVENIQKTFEIPQYDSEGKKIETDYVRSAKFSKGGLVRKIKGYKHGGETEVDYDPNYPVSGVVQVGGQGQQFTPTGNTNQGNQFYKAYKKPTQDEVDANDKQMASSITNGVSSFDKGDNKGGAGNKIGGVASKVSGSMGWLQPAMQAQQSVRAGIDRDVMVDPTTGESYSKASSKKGAIIEETATPFHEKFGRDIKKGDLRSTGVQLLGGTAGTMIYNETVKKKELKEKEQANVDKVKSNIRAANAVAKQQQAINARDEGNVDPRLTDIYDPNSYTYSVGYKKGGLVSKIYGYADGGEIKGQGGPKDDKIKAKVEGGSYVVPAENADKAKALRKALLMKPNKKANLNQKGGEEVKLSDGEHLFTPEEKHELMEKGVDLDKLAPNSEHKMKQGKEHMEEMKEYVMFPKVVGFKKGGEVDPAKEKAKIAAEEKAIADAKKKKEDYEAILDKTRAQQKEIYARKKERESKIKEWDSKHKDAKTKLDALKKAYDEYSTEMANNPITKNEKSLGVVEIGGIKNPDKIREDKKKILADIEKAQSEYDNAKRTYDYVKDDKNYTPEGKSKIEAGKVNPKAPKANPKQVSTTPTETKPTATTTTPKVKGSGIAGKVMKGASEQMPTRDITSTELKRDAEIRDAKTIEGADESLASKEINTDGYSAPKYGERKSKFDLSGLKNADPTAFLGIGQTALGLKMLKGQKRPTDTYNLDPTYNEAVNRSIQDAKFGLTPEAKFAAEQDLQNALNDARFSARTNAGGSGANAFNMERSAINSAWRNKLGLKVADQEERARKQMYADQQVASRASLQDSLRRRAFTDAMETFQQKQQAGSELIGAGLANQIGAYRFRRNLDAMQQSDKARTAWSDNYGQNNG